MRGLPLFVARSFWALLLGVTLFQVEAAAQPGGPQATVMQLNQQAMTAYGNLQFPEAMQLLQQAEALCNQYNLRGTPLARTYVNMGMVEFGGSGNNAGALEYFKKALCLDRTVMLDPLNSTPDVEMLFTGAQNQVQAPGACGAPTPPPTTPGYPPTTPGYPPTTPGYPPTTPPPTTPPPATMQLIQHMQVTQQVRMTPIPIFAQVNPNVQVGQVILFYRTIGERIFQQVPMTQKGNGWGASIGCDVMRTFDPTGIEYYIAVLDPNNRLLGTSGSEAQPHTTAIVATLTTPPPSFPNEAPPMGCQEECPPWDPACGACKQFGDLCDSDAQCCSGMVCVNETCTQSDGGGGGGGGDFTPHFRLPILFGTGAGLVTGGGETPYNQVSNEDLTIGTGFAWSKFHGRLNPMIYIPKVEGLAVGLSARLGIHGDPKWSENGLMPITPSIMAAVSYKIAGTSGNKGFELHFLAGLGYSVIYNRVSYQDCSPVIADDEGETNDGYDYEEGDIICDQDYVDGDGWTGEGAVSQNFFRKADAFGIEVGLDAYYWFVPQFGIAFGLMADAVMPNFVLNFDLNLGVALRF